mmetsp:Transcript_172663/g.553367  ORF Transcript_172663/g.553367 Transcript_172663/m.553367 type:complete len:225 (+) Transcript_172663:2612-3286(+)
MPPRWQPPRPACLPTTAGPPTARRSARCRGARGRGRTYGPRGRCADAPLPRASGPRQRASARRDPPGPPWCRRARAPARAAASRRGAARDRTWLPSRLSSAWPWPAQGAAPAARRQPRQGPRGLGTAPPPGEHRRGSRQARARGGRSCWSDTPDPRRASAESMESTSGGPQPPAARAPRRMGRSRVPKPKHPSPTATPTLCPLRPGPRARRCRRGGLLPQLRRR